MIRKFGLVMAIASVTVGAAFAQSPNVDFARAWTIAANEAEDSAVVSAHLRESEDGWVYVVRTSGGERMYIDGQNGRVLLTITDQGRRRNRDNRELILEVLIEDSELESIDSLVASARDIAERDDLSHLALMPGREGLSLHAVFVAEDPRETLRITLDGETGRLVSAGEIGRGATRVRRRMGLANGLRNFAQPGPGRSAAPGDTPGFPGGGSGLGGGGRSGTPRR